MIEYITKGIESLFRMILEFDKKNYFIYLLIIIIIVGIYVIVKL